jgi:DNA-directed RNA polymerase subunit omega
MLPSPDILNDFQPGKFVLSNLAAKRAKQLREGAPPLVHIDSNHPLTIALAEIAAGKIKAVLPSPDAAILEPLDVQLVVDEDDIGMLLPALDEHEVSLVEEIGADHDDHEEHEVHEGEDREVLALTDLVEADEEEPAAAAGDDTLSLSDIAEQETTLEDEEPEE